MNEQMYDRKRLAGMEWVFHILQGGIGRCEIPRIALDGRNFW